MLTNPSWPEIALRLGLAAVAGMLVGFNREARSQAAGLRTTTLLCLAACLAMVVAIRMLSMSGPDPKAFMRLDVMRLPLGVLTGIGFIGAGAIIRRGDAVAGVATAATLWFMTIVGLTFGAGELALGAVATAAALLVLWLLKSADLRVRRMFRASLTVYAEPSRFGEPELRRLLSESGQRIVAWSVTYYEGGERYEARAEVEWSGRTEDRAKPPDFLFALATHPGVRQADWTPQAVSA